METKWIWGNENFYRKLDKTAFLYGVDEENHSNQYEEDGDGDGNYADYARILIPSKQKQYNHKNENK
jgi:hypothetical protein